MIETPGLTWQLKNNTMQVTLSKKEQAGIPLNKEIEIVMGISWTSSKF